MLNSNRYPTLDYNLSFPVQQFSRAYGDAAEFRSKFFDMNELISNPNFTPSEYKTLYPLFLFDVSSIYMGAVTQNIIFASEIHICVRNPYLLSRKFFNI